MFSCHHLHHQHVQQSSPSSSSARPFITESLWWRCSLMALTPDLLVSLLMTHSSPLDLSRPDSCYGTSEPRRFIHLCVSLFYSSTCLFRLTIRHAWNSPEQISKSSSLSYGTLSFPSTVSYVQYETFLWSIQSWLGLVRTHTFPQLCLNRCVIF